MITCCEGEEWLPLKGWDGIYEISSCGRVRSISRTVSNGRGTRFIKGIVRKPTWSAQRLGAEYLVVSVTATGRKRQLVRIHRAVLESFVGLPLQGCDVARHLNDDRSDNHLHNLAWGTHEDNMRDRDLNGGTCVGVKQKASKLTDDDARVIFNSDESGVLLAARYGVSPSAISLVRKGKSWRHVTLKEASDA
ncbi:NUMOD4 domain-containing protein [Aeromonas veronii]|uniref:NUMOD4 domain-containing protein n=1 Tax=Aeromonas salmonicida TaxID=645 RepID=UPI00036CF9D1|nr:NUMOD4 domain-containing protein [Aeromonas salmonicida]